MSVITFKCASERKEEVKQKCFEILHNHYSNSVFPNTRVKYEHEGEEVYSERMKLLMKEYFHFQLNMILKEKNEF